MRESNFSFPQQNRACLCITSQLYDRRALDTNSALPLFNSLTHLTYLTSTSPRIREILTSDGGLERLVRLLRDFCMRPPPPESPSFFYGLTPPGASYHALMAKQSPGAFDQAAAYRFSLAFQCIVNIGVRGSEAIRSRVVQAGTLDAVGCILETWLRSRGFVTYPCGSASGMIKERETREERAQRREQKLKEAHELASRFAAQQMQLTGGRHHTSSSERVTDMMSDSEMHDAESTDTSADHTPRRSNSPAESPARSTHNRDRSETITPRHVDQMHAATVSVTAPNTTHGTPATRRRTSRSQRRSTIIGPGPAEAGPSNPTPATTRHENNPASGSASDASPSRSPSPAIAPNPALPANALVGRGMLTHPHAVGIVDTDPTSPTTFAQHGPMDLNLIDADMVMNMREGLGLGALDVNRANDDLAMGAPPGAPGATVGIAAPVPDPVPDSGANTPVPPDPSEDGEEVTGNGNVGATPATPRTSIEATPRAASNDLPISPTTAGNAQGVGTRQGPGQNPLEPQQTQLTPPLRPPNPGPQSPQQAVARTVTVGTLSRRRSFYIPNDTPYREEDVLLSLQLLAYLSKYPHVRQAFYMPRNVLGTGDAIIKTAGTYPCQTSGKEKDGRGKEKEREKDKDKGEKDGKEGREISGSSFLKALGVGRGSSKEKEKEKESETPSEPIPAIGHHAPNVFSLVERFTFRPHPTESALPAPPFHLPPEIQYWAGVIMRNACRKDDSRGGIRQCANMICGKWERYPREFAKCRRCRKARYCGKECQSKAWSDGHRFWCSVKEGAPNASGAVTAGGERNEGDTASVATVRPPGTRRREGGPATRGGLHHPTVIQGGRLHGVNAAAIQQARQQAQANAQTHRERTDPFVDAPGIRGTPLPPGTVAFTTPTTGRHTVVVRMRPDGTIVERAMEDVPTRTTTAAVANHNIVPPAPTTPTAPIPIPATGDMMVVGTIPDPDVDMSFSPPIPANDIFSRDVDPDSFVRPVPRRRGPQAPVAGPSRSRQTTRTGAPTGGNVSASSSRSSVMDVDVEMG